MKRLIYVAVLIVLASQANGQSSDSEQTRSERNAEFKERSFVDRLAYGGEVSMFFGNISYVNLSPFIGYRLNPDLTVALGPSYQYWSYRFAQGPNGVNRSHIYGARAFVRHELGKVFFLHGEYEILNLEGYSPLNNTIGRINVEMASLGLGYKNLFNDFSYYYVMVLYDFIGSYNSPYPTSPIIFKAGFIFGK